jgi:hypothetical protein
MTADHLPPGTTCENRTAFADLLRAWFESSAETTIGEVGTFGGKALIHISLNGQACHLNADTRRDGVRRYLELVREHGADLAWTAAANNRGKVNKILVGPHQEAIRFFYLYTDEDLPATVEL